MAKVSSFYKFFPLRKTKLKSHQKKLREKALALNLKGLALVSEEGLNVSFCGEEKNIESYKAYVSRLFERPFVWKDSYSSKVCFKRLSVKIKKEIINPGVKGPAVKEKNNYLQPKEWEKKLKAKTQVLDIRNSYEVELGRFQGAKDLKLSCFQEFSKKLSQLDMDKNKETLIYCTGGIRCEKAMDIMKNKGFKKVYQLEGGILNYLKERPHSLFKKECFVFDHRTALDQNLKASKKYSLCPHCGQAGDIKMSCNYCDKPAVICKLCSKKAFYYKTCSKNCAYHFKSGHQCRKKHISKI